MNTRTARKYILSENFIVNEYRINFVCGFVMHSFALKRKNKLWFISFIMYTVPIHVN